MPVFSIEKSIIKEVPERPFVLEKNIQKLVEYNLQAIFGVSFVTSEFELNNLRVDTLGFDKESNSFVIVEYKRDKSFSVIDQGYAYLALLLNNKAEFILIYNEKNKGLLRKDSVDWTQSKVIFVSSSFTTYQRKAIEFKDLPIELWEAKLYANNTILFNQIQTPEKSESVNTISQRSELVRSVSKQVRVYDEESHFESSNDNIKQLYSQVKESILSIGPDVSIRPRVKYISFVRKRNFVDIVVRKTNLTLFLNAKIGLLNDPKGIARDVSKVGHWGNGDYEVVLKKPSDLGYVNSLIRQSYENN